MMQDNIYLITVTNCCTGNTVLLDFDTQYAQTAALEAIQQAMALMGEDDCLVEFGDLRDA